LALIVATLAQFADLVTAHNMPAHKYEVNPLGALLLTDPLAALAVKAALALLIVSTVVVIRPKRPMLGHIVTAFAITFGLLGAFSNT